MKLKYIAILLASVFIMAGCIPKSASVNGGKEYHFPDDEFPPVVHGYVNINETKYEMDSGNYKWRKGNSTVTTDHAGPVQVAPSLTPITVKKGEQMKIEVEQNPQLTAFLWKEDERSEYSSGSDMNAPEEPGRYIFEVVSKWSNGEVSYVFVIDVE